MLSNAFALALVTTGGCYAIYSKLPRKVRRFIQKYGLLADMTALVGTYMLLGGTLTALMAGALVGLFTSALLHIANNQEDFLYLYDLRDMLRDRLTEAKQALSEYGQNYRRAKELNNLNIVQVPGV